MSLTTIIISIVWILAISIVKAIRFFIILSSGEIKVPFIKSVLVFITSQAFTPLPGGETARALLFKHKMHLKLEQVTIPVYLQAVIELWTATFLALISIFIIQTSFGVWLGLGLAVMLVILTWAIFAPKKFVRLLDYLKVRGFKYKWANKLGIVLDVSEQYIIKKNGTWRWKLWLIIIALGLVSQIMAGGLIWYIANLQGVSLSVFQCLFVAVVAVLIQSILAFIPGGLGVTEGGLIGVLTAFGIGWNKSIVITLLYRVLTLPLLVIISLFFLFIIYLPNIFRKLKSRQV